MGKKLLATLARHSFFILIAFILVGFIFSLTDRGIDIVEGVQQAISQQNYGNKNK